MGIANAVLVNK